VLIVGGESPASSGPTASALLFDPTTGSLSPTGSMSAPRRYHAATLLPNGKVLVTGGQSNSSYALATAELYDPSTGVFTGAGSMQVTRINHSATLLANGKVLIAGGIDNNNNLPLTAEIYDPASGLFAPSGGVMPIGRAAHTATLLGDGKVLIAGGGDNNLTAGIFEAELYDPAIDRFTVLASAPLSSAHAHQPVCSPPCALNYPRIFHTATLLNDGRVLIAGGQDGSYGLVVAELYDPVRQIFTRTGGDMVVGRYNHAATLLSSGKVLLSGGTRFNLFAPATAEAFDPSGNGGEGKFIQTDSMTSPRQFHTATLIPTAAGATEGTVFIAGGRNYGNVATFLSSTEVYNPTPVGGAGQFLITGRMRAVRYNSTATQLTNGHVLIAGGSDAQGNALATAELYNPVDGTFIPAGTMHSPRFFHSATLLGNGKVVIAGGATSSSIGNALNSAELYDPVSGAFTTIPTPMTDAREQHAATLLANGKVLISGGFDQSTVVKTAEIFDPSRNGGAGGFTAAGGMTLARHQHTSTLLSNGTVLITGGGGGSSAELFDPAGGGGAGTFRATGMMTAFRSGNTATLLPNGKVLITGGLTSDGTALNSAEIFDPSGNAGIGSFTATGNMHIARAFHRGVLLDTGLVLIMGGTAQSSNATDIYALTSELFDPTGNGGVGAFTTSGLLNLPRGQGMFTATLLPTGKVLIATAGQYANSSPIPQIGADIGQAEVYQVQNGLGVAASSISILGASAIDTNGKTVSFTGLPATLGTVRVPSVTLTGGSAP